jgi:Uma2 family endonuclease
MQITAEQVGMPLNEFIQLLNEQPFELINGVRRLKMPNVAGHNVVSRRAWKVLDQHVEQFQLGEVLYEDVFVLSYTTQWVTGPRIPDVMFYRAERLVEYKAAVPDWKDKPYILVPDLVIEVVSPNDNLVELEDKVDQYLLDGVQAVWVMDPQRHKISLHELISRVPFQKKQTNLRTGDMLDGSQIIPGFQVAVRDLLE